VWGGEVQRRLKKKKKSFVSSTREGRIFPLLKNIEKRLSFGLWHRGEGEGTEKKNKSAGCDQNGEEINC